MKQKCDYSSAISIYVWHDDEANVYVSHCPVIKLYSQGRDETEAAESMEGAIELYINNVELRYNKNNKN